MCTFMMFVPLSVVCTHTWDGCCSEQVVLLFVFVFFPQVIVSVPCSLIRNFSHPNILKVLGVCVDNDPVYIILELMPGGDLLKFLRKAKMDHVCIMCV